MAAIGHTIIEVVSLHRCRCGRNYEQWEDQEMDGGLGIIERDTTVEPSGDRFNVGDDTRGDHKACGVHGAGTRGAHGM